MPADRDEIWRWDAVDIARGVRRRQVTATEVACSHLERIAAVNPALNALVDLSADDTLRAAAQLDARIAAGEDAGPLAGVPTAIKINTDQAGYATSHGVRLLRGAVATTDAPVVANLRRAGALPIGRGNSPAFGYRAFTSNALHGTTLSPWDVHRTPGGSSGGSGVAVATGMAALGQGNDLAGSIRYPAYASGLVGLRPTVGRVPRGSVLSGVGESLMTQLMTVDGPLARTTADLRLMYEAMSARGDARDLFWYPQARPATVPPKAVGVLRATAEAPLHPAVDRALDVAASYLAEHGYHVAEVRLPQLEEAYRLWWYLCISEYQGAGELLDQSGDKVAATVVRNYETIARRWWPKPASLPDYLAAQGRRQVLIQELQEAMEQLPLLLLPVSTEAPFEHDLDARSLADTERFMHANWSMMALPAVALPGIAVPTGLVDGVPMGVQIVGRRNDDWALIDAAEVIEAHVERITPTDVRWSGRAAAEPA